MQVHQPPAELHEASFTPIQRTSQVDEQEQLSAPEAYTYAPASMAMPSNGYDADHDLDGEIDYSDIEQKCVHDRRV